MSSLPFSWFSDLYRFSNKPDENLGRHSIGESLCRITSKSCEDLFGEFSRIDARLFGMSSRTFVDLGCGRGMVCAAAMHHVPSLTRVIGWDIDAREIAWAREHVGGVVSAASGALACKLRFEVANALEFCAARDISPFAADQGSPGHPMPLLDNESVWIYAFWADWGESTMRKIAKHLLLEDYGYWSVLACSRGHGRANRELLELVADGDVLLLARLRDMFKCVGQVPVKMCGSASQRTIYFYVKTF